MSLMMKTEIIRNTEKGARHAESSIHYSIYENGVLRWCRVVDITVGKRWRAEASSAAKEQEKLAELYATPDQE